jgi:hypothetical protein
MKKEHWENIKREQIWVIGVKRDLSMLKGQKAYSKRTEDFPDLERDPYTQIQEG